MDKLMEGKNDAIQPKHYAPYSLRYDGPGAGGRCETNTGLAEKTASKGHGCNVRCAMCRELAKQGA